MDPKSVAVEVVTKAAEGRFREVEALFAPPLRAQVSAKTLRVAWAGQIGPVTEMGLPMSEPGPSGLVRVTVPVVGERGAVDVVMSVDGAGRLNGLRLAASSAPWTPPPYVDLGRFAEEEATIGEGPLAVRGALSLPRHATVGAVLLSGGGPFDRDETSGANKPLKDLAWGLASLGVAVVRFDKVTHSHARHIAGLPEFTMTDEYVPHATAAIRLLQKHVAKVFLVGHSMGGRVASRVAMAEPSVAGLVLMAADAQPMHRAAVRVARYLAALNAEDPEGHAAVELFEKQAARVDSAELSAATPATELPFGYSGAYWLDQRADDPVATAAVLDKPMLILQGRRDYQVTVDDDFALWKAGLGHRSDVDFRIFEAGNHLFFPGSGPSTPAEYQPAQHMDPVVVEEIAEWLFR